ncbi:HRDC domain-containing protein [Cohnella nanjingensis]|uniref:HRDC domain-containing protein n=1 Tax=Cohnella nanjingensis TaxID=1387779 RepID=A0A7X0VD77_9BACL|nr:HRDC domain-containing protein [Cohnella nanjingensis]MBB6669685.1 HRDC domain-containing protein [Cohnella nanjingensis]
MQIVFLNRFERETGVAEDERGQVFIGEEQGNWSAGWHALPAQGEPGQELWYEGTSWEELLTAFRHGVAKRMREGFRPLLDGMLEDTPFWERRPQLQALLQCYADGREGAEELLVPLRLWRRAKAAEEKRAAYMIATNRELQMLAVYVPQTLAELQQVPGFGKLKTERYGADIVALLSGYERSHAYPLDWVAEAVSAEAFADWTFRQKEERYGKSLSLVQDKRKLLAGIRQGRSLSELAEELQCPRRTLLEKVERLDEEGYDVLPLVELELSEIPEAERDGAIRAMGELGDRYLKPLQKRVYGTAEAEEGEIERQFEKLRIVRIRFRRDRQVAV